MSDDIRKFIYDDSFMEGYPEAAKRKLRLEYDLNLAQSKVDVVKERIAKRDQLAAMAMQGLLASGEKHVSLILNNSYDLAEAMLAEAARRNEK